MIKQTIFAVSLQESRPLLTGLNLKIEKNNLINQLEAEQGKLEGEKKLLEKEYSEAFPYQPYTVLEYYICPHSYTSSSSFSLFCQIVM